MQTPFYCYLACIALCLWSIRSECQTLDQAAFTVTNLTTSLEKPAFFKSCESAECNVEALNTFFTKHQKTPEKTINKSIEGVVTFQFDILPSGLFDNLAITDDPEMAFTAEIKRIMQRMPRWSAAVLNNEAIISTIEVKLPFQISEEAKQKKAEAARAAQEEKDKMVYKVCEFMPHFPGCANEESIEFLRECSEGKMNNYIRENLYYPHNSRIQTGQHLVVVRFIIEKDGSITNTTVLRGITDIYNQAALDLVNSMPKWVPGQHKGSPVRVQYTLPISFR